LAVVKAMKRTNAIPGGDCGRRLEPGTLIRRLIERLGGGRAPTGDAGDQAPEDLRPPGRRSGRGTESIAAYLDHGRNTKPGPLE
jgi:hypothetical protein